jgi:hypothetical protein
LGDRSVFLKGAGFFGNVDMKDLMRRVGPVGNISSAGDLKNAADF